MNIDLLNDGFLIFSAEKAELPESDNVFRHVAMRATLNALVIPFISVEGVYKGTKEMSFLVPTIHHRTVLALASVFSQETVLIKHASFTEEVFSQAFLITVDDTDERIRLGKWVEIALTEAEGLDNYSIINGRYFTTKG